MSLELSPYSSPKSSPWSSPESRVQLLHSPGGGGGGGGMTRPAGYPWGGQSLHETPMTFWCVIIIDCLHPALVQRWD